MAREAAHWLRARSRFRSPSTSLERSSRSCRETYLGRRAMATSSSASRRPTRAILPDHHGHHVGRRRPGPYRRVTSRLIVRALDLAGDYEHGSPLEATRAGSRRFHVSNGGGADARRRQGRRQYRAGHFLRSDDKLRRGVENPSPSSNEADLTSTVRHAGRRSAAGLAPCGRKSRSLRGPTRPPPSTWSRPGFAR